MKKLLLNVEMVTVTDFSNQSSGGGGGKCIKLFKKTFQIEITTQTNS